MKDFSDTAISTAVNATPSITREIYEGFQRGEFQRWDAVIDPDVELLSGGNWGGRGIDLLKTWGGEFVKSLKPRIDLVDEHEAIDANGNGRAFITVNLNWKHAEPFFDLKPTGREGTSVETFIFTIRNGKVVRFGVADNTLDLSIYLWERGWPQVHNIRPTAIITGIERR